MLVGDFVEDYEVMVPFQALRMAAPRLKLRNANRVTA